MSMPRAPIALTIDGHRFIVRNEEPGLYHFAWLTGPRDYGFSVGLSHGAAMDPGAMEASIRDFLSQINPATGHIDD